MVTPNNETIKVRVPNTKGVLTGLNLLTTISTHKDSRETLAKVMFETAKETEITPKILMDCLMEALEFVESLNKSLFDAGETPDGKLKK